MYGEKKGRLKGFCRSITLQEQADNAPSAISMRLTQGGGNAKNTSVRGTRGSIMSAPCTENYGVFFPEEVELLGRVYRETLASAKSPQSGELLEGLIASEIIGLAKVGERDPHKLQSLILAKLGLRPSR